MGKRGWEREGVCVCVCERERAHILDAKSKFNFRTAAFFWQTSCCLHYMYLDARTYTHTHTHQGGFGHLVPTLCFNTSSAGDIVVSARAAARERSLGGRDKRELVPEHHVLMALEGHLSKAGVVSCFIPPYMQYVRRRKEEVSVIQTLV